MFTQLNPNLPLYVMGKGDGFALGVIDYGQEHNLIWVTVLNANGEVWCAPNPSVRFGPNWTMGRSESSAICHDKQEREKSTNPADGICDQCTQPSSVTT